MKTIPRAVLVGMVGSCLCVAVSGATNGVWTSTGTGAVVTPPWTCGETMLREFTVSAWIKPSAVTGATDQVVVERVAAMLTESGVDAWRANFRIGVNLSGCPFVFYEGAGAEPWQIQATSTNRIAADQWTHLAGRYEWLELSLYCNGVRIARCPSSVWPHNGWLGVSPGPTLSLPGVVTIGARNHDPIESNTNMDSFFTGAIDEVTVWDGALSPTDIQTYMYAKPTGTETNLVGYWSFDNGTAGDGSSNTNHGTLVNSTGSVQNITFPTTARINLTTDVAVSFQTVQDANYQVLASAGRPFTNWVPMADSVTGNGLEMTVVDTNATQNGRFYRIVAH